MHGTCGLNNPWHHLRKMSSWVGNPGRPPYVIPRGSAGFEKKSKPFMAWGPLLQYAFLFLSFFPYGLEIINDYRHLSIFFTQNASLLDYYLTILYQSSISFYYTDPSISNPSELLSILSLAKHIGILDDMDSLYFSLYLLTCLSFMPRLIQIPATCGSTKHDDFSARKSGSTNYRDRA